MKLTFHTIGHSTRSLGEFLELLSEARIERITDVRKIPRSRTHPQFNQDTLPEALKAHHISYEHLPTLGGRRGKSATSSADVNAFWTNQSFRNYADYALTQSFHDGLEHLLDEGRKQRCAIMCAEAVWWRCHRRIIADYLIASGNAVLHIMGPGRVETARLTPGAVIQPDGTLIYPAVSQPRGRSRQRVHKPGV